MDFQLVSDYKPTGDQPEAIEKLTWGVKNGLPEQVAACKESYTGQYLKRLL